MNVKLRGLNGSIQRMHELQARIAALTPQPRGDISREVGPNPKPGSEFSDVLGTGNVKPLDPFGNGLGRTADRAPHDLRSLIEIAANKAGIEPALFEALVGQESSYDANAVSAAGAKGLAQLMPKTATALGVTNIFDPVQNLDAGARYLAEMLRQFNGDKKLALAAYNAGPATVRQVNGVPEESAGYVRDVLARAASISSSGP